MRIAIVSDGKTLNANVNLLFARSHYFIFFDIVDNKIKTSEAIENLFKDDPRDVATAVVNFLNSKKVDVTILDEIAPKALNILHQSKIKIYRSKGIIKDAIDDYLKGELKQI